MFGEINVNKGNTTFGYEYVQRVLSSCVKLNYWNEYLIKIIVVHASIGLKTHFSRKFSQYEFLLLKFYVKYIKTFLENIFEAYFLFGHSQIFVWTLLMRIWGRGERHFKKMEARKAEKNQANRGQK